MTSGSIGPSEVPLARALARASLAVDFGDFDAKIIAKAKICLLDFLSCAFEARNHPWSRQAIGIARGIENGATIVGTSKLSTPGDAAFANATLGHGLVREDMHAASICHHGVVIWPTLLALSERTPLSGATLLGGCDRRLRDRRADRPRTLYRRSGAALSADRIGRAAGRRTGRKPCARSRRRCRNQRRCHCRQHIVRPERMAACRRLRDVFPSGFCGPQRYCGDRTRGSRRLRLGNDP